MDVSQHNVRCDLRASRMSADSRVIEADGLAKLRA